jgi:hypothetical protein
VSTNATVYALSFGLTFVGGAVVLWGCGPRLPAGLPDRPDRVQFLTWEHDRVNGLAKGIGSAAGPFFASVLIAALRGELDPHVSTCQVIGCFLGIIGCFGAAGWLQLEARAFVERDGAPRP